MHKILLNTLELKFRISPVGPVLIKSGTDEGADPTLPNMNFVRGIHPKSGQRTIYLPGSSLKGVIRSHAERIIRTVNLPCCDPLSAESCDRKPAFRENNRQIQRSGEVTYRNLCTACRLFGHTVMASRFFIQDAYPKTANDVLATRQMVAIDRRSGGSVNTFTMEVSTQDVFEARLVVRNFERWQFGLIGLILRDLHLGRIGIGFAKSRGFGQVALSFETLSIRYTGKVDREVASGSVLGVSELLTQSNRGDMIDQYGFASPDTMAIRELPADIQARESWAETEVDLHGDEETTHIFRAMSSAWQRFVQLGHS